MARLFRSPLARRDITEVLGSTRDRWGEAQALEYRDLIRDALKAIAANPYFRAFSGCAGAQLDFPAQQFQGVAEVWVPFEEAIAMGWRYA